VIIFAKCVAKDKRKEKCFVLRKEILATSILNKIVFENDALAASRDG